MSLHLLVRPDRPLTGEALRAGLPAEVALEPPLPDGPLAGQWSAWLPGRSTRATSIDARDGALELAVPFLACRDDLRLARDLVQHLLDRCGGTVSTPRGRLDADGFRAAYDGRWVAEQERRDLDLATRELHAGVRVHGPRVDVVIGDEELARLRATPAWAHTLLREAQWPGDPDAWRRGEPPALHLPEVRRLVADRATPTWSAWSPFRDTVLGPVELVQLPRDPDRLVPIGHLRAVLGERVRRLPGGSMRIDALDEAAWAAAREPLRAGAVGLDAAAATTAVTDPAAEPAGVLLPVLRPAAWGERAAAACRPLVPGAPSLPLVSWAWDRPGAVSVVLRSHPRAADPDALHEAARAALAAREITLAPMHDPDGEIVLLTCTDEYAAELALSPRHLRDAAHRLGARALAVATPCRGLFAACARDRPAHVEALSRLARLAFEEAPGDGLSAALTPTLLEARDGALVGPLALDGAARRALPRWVWVAVAAGAVAAAWALGG